MIAQLFRNWWLFLVRGLLAITFGVVSLIWPEQAKLALVVLFGAFALANGFVTAAAAISLKGYIERWWTLLLEGISGIAVGVLTFIWPNITGLVLLYFIAAWAVVTGIFEIMVAIHLRRVIPGEWAMILSGLLSTVFGILLFVFPGAGAVSIVWLIGTYAMIAGIALSVFAFRLRRLSQDISKVIAF